MKLTKQQKILLGLVGAGILALTADRLFVLKPQETSTSDNASEYAIAPVTPAGAAAAAPGAKPQPAVVPISVAERLRITAQPFLNNPVKDAFVIGPAWRGTTEIDKGGSDNLERFQHSHRLTGVLTAGGQSTAMIDGKLVTIGQIVDGLRLTSISHRSATFESDDQRKVVLGMSERVGNLQTVAGAGQ